VVEGEDVLTFATNGLSQDLKHSSGYIETAVVVVDLENSCSRHAV
jgi:hypothetical protein